MESYKTIIRPESGFRLRLGELWQQRELLYFFAWRDIKVKYKQTILGIAWAILQPLGLMLLFSFIFSRSSLADTANGTDYKVFVLSGLIWWNFFSSAVVQSSESMISNAAIIRKIYFPRLVIPIASIIASMLDLLIGMLLFLIFCLISRQTVSWHMVYMLPLAFLVTVIFAFGLGAFLGALNVKFRDFRYALPFLIQVLFFATQVIYSLDIFEGKPYAALLYLNPMNAVIALFRYPLNGLLPSTFLLLGGVSVALLTGFAGLFYFRKTERFFADII